MSTLCLIPARKNSKGLKNKNIKKLNKVPLINYPYRLAKRCQFITDIAVSSDSKKYLNLIKKDIGKKKTFLIKRPSYLAGDKTLIYDVVMHALNIVNKKFDFIIILEPTSPLTSIIDLNNAFNIFYRKINKVSSIVSIVSIEKFNYRFRILTNTENIIIQKKYPNNLLRQALKKQFFLSGNFYISKVNAYLKNRGFISDKTYGYEVNKRYYTDIDDLIDFKFAEFLIKNK